MQRKKAIATMLMRGKPNEDGFRTFILYIKIVV
jgi:hypothetical protein